MASKLAVSTESEYAAEQIRVTDATAAAELIVSLFAEDCFYVVETLERPYIGLATPALAEERQIVLLGAVTVDIGTVSTAHFFNKQKHLQLWLVDDVWRGLVLGAAVDVPTREGIGAELLSGWLSSERDFILLGLGSAGSFTEQRLPNKLPYDGLAAIVSDATTLAARATVLTKVETDDVGCLTVRELIKLHEIAKVG